MSNTLVSCLPEEIYNKILMLANQINDKYGLKDSFLIKYPHFSWQADRYDLDKLEPAIKEFGTNNKGVEITTDGIATFDTHGFVIYIKILKDDPFKAFHKNLYSFFKPYLLNENDFYNPENIIPHITIAFNSVKREDLESIKKDFLNEDFKWRFRLDNIAVIDVEGKNFEKYDLILKTKLQE
jgi:2'-5' RNA ligase